MTKIGAKKIQSMTGYGRGTAASAHFLVQVELRSVNGRFLEIRPKLPRALLFFEARLREVLQAQLRRGMVDAQVSLQVKGDETLAPIDHARVRAYAEEAKIIGEHLDIPSGLDVLGLLRLPGTVTADEGLTPELEEEAASLVVRAAEKALAELTSMRSLEGEKLQTCLERDLASLRTLQQKILGLRDMATESLRKRITERVNRSIKEFSLQLDQGRLVQELAFYADRSDVTEELDRLGSHLDQFHKALQSPDQVGKRCDFLLQEIAREINTIGAKVDLLELSQTVVDMKLLAEKLREQVQNLE